MRSSGRECMLSILRIHEWSLFPSLIFPQIYLVDMCPAGFSLKLCVCVMCARACPCVSECAAASLIKNMGNYL